MEQQDVLDIVSLGLQTVIYTAMPLLLTGLVVGLAISIFQTVTSIQDATLSFVPKILAMFLALMFFGPYMLEQLSHVITVLYSDFYKYVR